MAIITVDDFQISPREDLIAEIMDVINIAIMSDEHHHVVSIAQEVVKVVERSKFFSSKPTLADDFWNNDADDLGE